jgi:hypothetical protein
VGKRVPPWSLAAVASGCAYRGAAGAGKPSEAATRLANEAATLAPIANEEDFLEAKFLYQALAQGSEEQARLRLKMVEYLLGPLATLDAQRLRRDPSMLGSDDDFDRLHDSLRDALDLFPGVSALASRRLGCVRSRAELVGIGGPLDRGRLLAARQ